MMDGVRLRRDAGLAEALGPGIGVEVAPGIERDVAHPLGRVRIALEPRLTQHAGDEAGTVEGSDLFPARHAFGEIGEQTLYQAVSATTGATMLQVYRRHYKWVTGLSVADWRYTGRIANIDVTQLLSGNAPNLFNAMIRLLNRLPTAPSSATNVQTTDSPQDNMMGQTVFYVNRVINTYLHIQAANKANAYLTMQQYAGMPIPTFLGIPVRTMDALLSTEARVT